MRLQVFKLLICQLKHKIGRKSIKIAPNLFIQSFDFNAIELAQILIENYLVSPDHSNRTFNSIKSIATLPSLIFTILRTQIQ